MMRRASRRLGCRSSLLRMGSGGGWGCLWSCLICGRGFRLSIHIWVLGIDRFGLWVVKVGFRLQVYGRLFIQVHWASLLWDGGNILRHSFCACLVIKNRLGTTTEPNYPTCPTYLKSPTKHKKNAWEYSPHPTNSPNIVNASSLPRTCNWNQPNNLEPKPTNPQLSNSDGQPKPSPTNQPTP